MRKFKNEKQLLEQRLKAGSMAEICVDNFTNWFFKLTTWHVYYNCFILCTTIVVPNPAVLRKGVISRSTGCPDVTVNVGKKSEEEEEEKET